MDTIYIMRNVYFEDEIHDDIKDNNKMYILFIDNIAKKAILKLEYQKENKCK